MIKCNFNKDLQVLEVIYEGKINTEDIINHAKFISENKKLPRILNIITDARNAQYDFNLEAANETLKFLEQSVKNHEFIKDAFIHSTPRETAYSMISEFSKKHNNYIHKVFTTEQAALNWLIGNI